MNAREERFCEEYLIDLNATRAAIRAGYASRTAEDAARWLKAGDDREKPGVRARIDRALAERSRRTGVTQDRVIRELARLAFASALDVINPDTATILPDASEDDRAIIQSVRVKTFSTKEGEGVEREVKMADKLKALELLGRHLGMYTDRVALIDDRPTIVDDIPDGGGGGGG